MELTISILKNEDGTHTLSVTGVPEAVAQALMILLNFIADDPEAVIEELDKGKGDDTLAG